jgi:hypothetical protein
MAGGAVAVEQARARQDEAPRTDGGDVAGRCTRLRHEFHHLRVVHQRHLARTTPDAQHVEGGTVFEGERGHQREADIAGDRLDPLPEQVDAGAGQAREHLEWPGHIELGHAREKEQSDL